MMKTEAVKTIFKSENFGLEDYTLTIDKISELDPQGNVMLVKLIAYVVDPLDNAMVFNYSLWLGCGLIAVALVMAMPMVYRVSGLKKICTHGLRVRG